MSAPRVFIWVQHLRGIGHAFRASRLARALVAAGAEVHCAWGGTRLPSIDLTGVTMVWLDPVKADGDHYRALLRPDGSPFDEAAMERRRDALLAAFAAVAPDILVTETFPFGRRQMRFELEPLLDAANRARPRPLIAASIRDIMQEGRAEKRVAESLAAVRRWFDLVLVHGDPRLAPIGASLQGADAIADLIVHAGLVTPDPPDLSRPPSQRARVVVSVGGGAMGHALTQAALDAPAHSRLFPDDWLLVAGPERPEAEVAELARRAGPGLRVVRHVPDLARILHEAEVSVSRAGYNTVGDLLRAGTRAVLVPYEGGRETEQRRRAELLAERGFVVALRDEDLSPASLGEAVDRAARLDRPALDLDLDGASQAARLLLERLEHRRRDAGPV